MFFCVLMKWILLWKTGFIVGGSITLFSFKNNKKKLQISTINPIINVSKGQLHRSCYWRLKRPNITPLDELLNYIKFSSVTRMHLISYENNKKKENTHDCHNQTIMVITLCICIYLHKHRSLKIKFTTVINQFEIF